MNNEFNIEWLLNFGKFIYKFRDIERTIYTKINDRRENDSEHSYQLAIICRYIISTKKLNLDIEKVIKYSLVHDLVEIYAWDTDTFWSKELKNSKEDREKESLKKIVKEFSEFGDMIKYIWEYETKSNDESRFVYAVDKIISPINIYNSEWYQRKDKKITLEMLIENKSEKIKLSSQANDIRKELCEIFANNKDKLFYKE